MTTVRSVVLADPYDEFVPSVSDVEQLLAISLNRPNATHVEQIGEGAWSTAFGFSEDGRDLVIRLGKHVTDFRRDQSMSRRAGPKLPIPDVLGVGSLPEAGERQGQGAYYCISTRAFGAPLEMCSKHEWLGFAEQVADACEAMRACTPDGHGDCDGDCDCDGDGDGTAVGDVATWREQLLLIERDDLDPRGAGWPAKLATSKRGSDAFQLGVAGLREIDVGEVSLTLVHGDLINRNVHVDAGSITGIFDWGCQRWGDHLFDVAWFDFWSPWHPNLDIGVLRAALRERWSAVGYVPDRESERTKACLTYIGLEHLIYNAIIGRWTDLDDVVDRMTALDLI